MLEFTIFRAKRKIKKIVRGHCPNAKVFHFGATNVNPRYLAIWIALKTDAERDLLQPDSHLQQQFRDALVEAGYPSSAVPSIVFTFESQETVDRDFKGSWWNRMK
jgi:hypothetical protein